MTGVIVPQRAKAETKEKTKGLRSGVSSFVSSETDLESPEIQNFEEIVAENESKIFNTIYSFVGEYDDALDLTQETVQRRNQLD